jgi:hypothetical protein
MNLAEPAKPGQLRLSCQQLGSELLLLVAGDVIWHRTAHGLLSPLESLALEAVHLLLALVELLPDLVLVIGKVVGEVGSEPWSILGWDGL